MPELPPGLPPELEERFRRVYAAIGETSSREPERYVRVGGFPATFLAGAGTIARITFDGGRSKVQLKNDAIEAVAAVANLKDHLKALARKQGQDPEQVEHLVNCSRELAVLVDLNNAEKHGVSSRDKGKSGLLPRLGEVTRALRFTGDGSPTHSFSITLTPGAGTFSNPRAQGNASSVIVADVLDEEGKKIGDGDLVGMIEAGLAAFEALLSSWGFALPPRQ